MMLAVRAVTSFLLLPGLVAFAVPLLVLPRTRAIVDPRAAVLLVPGLGLLLWCAGAFYRHGRGTLAPWDPPRRLVTAGVYRYSRNPMYVGVLLILLSWAGAFHSLAHVVYAISIALLFHARVIWHEEPYLARTHGPAWTAYRARVRRWV
jgi:protein-S-isoprenylcysteine O-methyltransferase Ste14